MRPIKTKTNAPKAALDGRVAAADTDGFFDRVLKLVPAEVIAGYTALLAIANNITTASLKLALPIALLACTLLTVLALRSSGKERKPPPLQYVFSVLGFWAWAMAIRDPLVPFGLATPVWIPAFACVLVPCFGSYLIGAVEN